jgi:hypothetical protein
MFLEYLLLIRLTSILEVKLRKKNRNFLCCLRAPNVLLKCEFVTTANIMFIVTWVVAPCSLFDENGPF